MFHTLLTPEQIDLLLPMLGASLILNMVLVMALVSRSVYRRLLHALDAGRIGILLWLRAGKDEHPLSR